MGVVLQTKTFADNDVISVVCPRSFLIREKEIFEAGKNHLFIHE